MEFKNDEEVLDFMTRLLERLHQAGFDQPGSHYQFVYVQACDHKNRPHDSQMDDCRERHQQCETLCPQRQHHYLPRLPEVH